MSTQLDSEMLIKIQENNDEQLETLNHYYSKISNPSDPKVLELLGISVDDAKDVKMFDSKGDLALYHFTNHKNEAVNHVRGIIIDTKKMKVVCKSFPFTSELPTSLVANTSLNSDDVIKNV